MRYRGVAVIAVVASSASADTKPELRDATYGYAVSPPQFALLRSGMAAARLTVFAPPEGGFSSNMGVLVQEMRTTREEYIAISDKGFGTAGFKVRSSAKREVSGAPAVVFDYEGQSGGRALRFLSLAVILKERVLLVTYTAEASKFPGLEAEFKRSLDSFVLAPQ